jgi:hypothetical protein
VRYAPGVRAVLLAIATAGCNSVFDIRTTGSLDASPIAIDVDTDLDGDGTVDRLDNCPIIPNDQTDRDSDGLGDVCDACPSGEIQSPADEDEDGIVDDCDNCPGIENRAQLDGDGDGLGDACDLLATTQHRVRFDGLSPPSSAWTTPWPQQGGGLVPATFPSEMKLPGVKLTGDTHHEWHVEAGVDLDLAATTDGTFGIRLTNPTTGAAFECGVAVKGPGGGKFVTGYNRLDPSLGPDLGEFHFVVPTTTLRASLFRPNPTDAAGIDCGWDVVTYSFFDGAKADAMLEVEVSLVAEIPELIRYVDIISE